MGAGTIQEGGVHRDFAGRVRGLLVTWSVGRDTVKFDGVSVGIDEVARAQLAQRGLGAGFFHEVMARGLYRVGVSEEELARVNHALTMHEKMELRLSLPCEFWPKKWREEGNAAQ